MQEKVLNYIDDALTATGFAVVDTTIAFRMRRDLWATPFSCASDFSRDMSMMLAIGARRGAALYQCAVEGQAQRVPVLAVSLDMLAQRIAWITGLRLTAITPYAAEATVVEGAPTAVDGEEIPAYPCAKRTEMLAKLGIKDTTYDNRTAFPPKVQRF